MQALAIALVLLTACAAKKSETASSEQIASCSSELLRSCMEYRDANLALGSDSLAKLCTAVDKDAKLTATACSRTGVIATCKYSDRDLIAYEGYPLMSQLEHECSLRGGTLTKK